MIPARIRGFLIFILALSTARVRDSDVPDVVSICRERTELLWLASIIGLRVCEQKRGQAGLKGVLAGDGIHSGTLLILDSQFSGFPADFRPNLAPKPL